MIRRFTDDEFGRLLDWYERCKADLDQRDHQLALTITQMAGRRAATDLFDAAIGHSDEARP